MEIKAKPCRGINKAFGVSGCGTKTPFRKHGLCMKCYAEFITETDAGKLIMQKAILKVQKPRIEAEAYASEYKSKNALKTAHTNTRMQVHSFVRERDKGKPCISCGAPWENSFQASHFYKSETFTTLKYNLDNINSSCVRCNLFLEGNFDNYSLILPSRIGQERYNALVELASIDKHQQKVWTLESLKEVRKNLKS